jgi:hypothetical protein
LASATVNPSTVRREFPPYVPPYRAISDKDFSSNSLSELALQPDEFVHHTREKGGDPGGIGLRTVAGRDLSGMPEPGGNVKIGKIPPSPSRAFTLYYSHILTLFSFITPLFTITFTLTFPYSLKNLKSSILSFYFSLNSHTSLSLSYFISQPLYTLLFLLLSTLYLCPYLYPHTHLLSFSLSLFLTTSRARARRAKGPDR